MQNPRWPGWTALAGMLLLGASAFAQQSVYAPTAGQEQRFTLPRAPVAADEPRKFPAAASVEARPMNQGHYGQFAPLPRIPVRLAAGEEPASPAGSAAPL